MIDREHIVEQHLKKRNYVITFANIDELPEEEYAKVRMSGFGASDTSKLLEVNPFPNGTLKDLIQEKVTGSWDETIGKKASVRMGKDIEHIILSKAEKMLDIEIYKPKHMYGSLETHLNTNFDGVAIIDEKVGYPVEAKAVTKYGRKYYDFTKAVHFQKDGEDFSREPIPEFEIDYFKNTKEYCERAAEYYGIPVYYYTQIQQQMMFLGTYFGVLAVLDVDNWDMNLFFIHRSEFVHNALKNSATKAWSKVQTIKDMKENPDEEGEDI